LTTGAGDADHAAGPADGPHATPIADVFVSYASTDAPVANAIVAGLERHGLRCWIAPRDVVPGSLYADGIVRAINGARVFVLVLSEHAVASGHVGKEVERASSKRRPIIALRTDQAPLTPAFEYFLSESQWIDVGPGGVAAAAAKLADAVGNYLGGGAAPAPGADSHAAAHASAPGGGRPGRARPNWTLIAAFAVIGLLLTWLLADRFWLSRRVGAEAPAPAVAAIAPAAPTISQKSVAVLPFIDLSEKKDQEYFSDGLAEELIDLLAKVPDLKVTARTSSFSFRGRAVTVGEIGQTLKVAHVLEGSVRKAGHTLRITAQLVRVDDGYHLWSETYDRDLKDVFKVQDDIARAVVEKLKLTLLDQLPAAPTRTANTEVHNLYLQGRYYSDTETKSGFEKAIDSFRRALAIDPGYAPAWAGLAFAHFREVANGYIDVRAGIELTRAEVQKAMALDPTLPDPYIVLSTVKMAADSDWAGARAMLDKALSLDPNSILALVNSGHLTRAIGSNEEALKQFRKTLERDPLNLLARRYMARVLYHAGRLDEAEAAVRQVLDLSPSFPAAHYELGRILLARGQVDAAIAEFEAEAAPGWRQFGLPLGYHAKGRTADANAALAAMVRNPAGIEYQIAETYAYFGETDKAIDWLNRAVGNDPGTLWTRGDPLLKSITGDPRYLAVLKRLNLPP
jgi:TolB-like protein/predicted negative regulator of RcsB-dependent stress response